jgi:aryl-alcohol dehydrogenase-like predicted oxidoreductase
MTTLAISWLAAQNPVSSVIAGATTPEQVAENAAAIKWRPSAEDLTEIDEICPPGRR